MPYVFIFIGCLGLTISSIGIYIPFIQQLDTSTVIWMSEHRSIFLNHVAITLSYLGGLPIMLLCFGVWCLQQIRNQKYISSLLIILSLIGGSMIGWILKYLFIRSRPDSIYQMVDTYGAAFPSAHSLYAAVLSCLFIFIFYKHKQAIWIKLFACFWFIGMGFSRVYLGAHFPTDVLAGWSIAFIWVALLWLQFSQAIFKRNKLFLEKNLNEVE